MKKPLIWFIWQGWIGKNYSDDLENRCYEVIRYSLDPQYIWNKDKIKDADIVFLAVPTPSTPEWFDFSIVREWLSLVWDWKIAVIKSTILPWTTDKLQAEFPEIYLFHSPEFLAEATAKQDVENPDRNIVGYTEKSQCKASDVMSVLPVAPYEKIIPVKEAELIKYGGNCFFYFKVIYWNLLYDMAKKLWLDYEIVLDWVYNDKRIGRTHLNPIHKNWRWAGGHCFVKDLCAFYELYSKINSEDKEGIELLRKLQEKNIKLMKDSNKDLDLLKGVYWENLTLNF